MPAYDRASTVVERVESCIAQDYPWVEIILIDDGSADGSPKKSAASWRKGEANAGQYSKWTIEESRSLAMYNPPIVIPAYRRHASLKRLLRTISEASYQSHPLIIISLEGGASKEVAEIAHEFASNRTRVLIKDQGERLGLRRHIIKCGDLSNEYGSVIILEDDLIVDRYFYRFAQAALNFYDDADKVAGIALYAPEFNEFAGLPFKPIRNGFDTYAIRTPCSWGQAWTAPQWQSFRRWYSDACPERVANMLELPAALRSWPESSWKKYFAAYIAEKKLFFVYPYTAYSSNCAEEGGEHIKSYTGRYQVHLALQFRQPERFSFAPAKYLDDTAYDAHMEANAGIVASHLGMMGEDLEVDLYGTKSITSLRKAKFAITAKPSNSPIRRYGSSLRPVEQNILLDSELRGEELGFVFSASEDVKDYAVPLSIDRISYFCGYELSNLKTFWSLASSIHRLIFNRIKRVTWRSKVIS